MRRSSWLLALASLLGASSCRHARPGELPNRDVVFAGAGDIACGEHEPGFNQGEGTGEVCAERATSDLLVGLRPDAVFVLGDEQYPAGSLEDFQRSYDRTWGRLKSITHPAAGNHEYATPGARGYFDYFGAAAGKPGEGYYSFELGAWHVVVLNSNCKDVACGKGSAQEQWLHSDLAAHPAQCTLAYWHHPRFSSGHHGDNLELLPFWEDLNAAGAELVLNGHDHDYERFGPQRPDGVADPARGLREIVVGSGGKSNSELGPPHANSERRRSGAYGVLKLTLHPDRYDWSFVSTRGAVLDEGQGRCHPR